MIERGNLNYSLKVLILKHYHLSLDILLLNFKLLSYNFLISFHFIHIEGTQPGFPFPNSGDPPGTPTGLKKKTFISFKPF